MEWRKRMDANVKYGIVKRFFDSGYGFIFCDDVPTDILFHLHNWRAAEDPVVGQHVTFILVPAKKEGNPPQAVLIRPIVSAGLAVLAKGITEGVVNTNQSGNQTSAVSSGAASCYLSPSLTVLQEISDRAF
jgi:cold shock CspA family protein